MNMLRYKTFTTTTHGRILTVSFHTKYTDLLIVGTFIHKDFFIVFYIFNFSIFI